MSAGRPSFASSAPASSALDAQVSRIAPDLQQRLIDACSRGEGAVVRALVNSGVSPWAYGDLPLTHAACSGSVECVKAVMDSHPGIPATEYTSTIINALSLAADAGNDPVVTWLCSRGGVSARALNLALCVAVRHRRSSTVSLLLDLGAVASSVDFGTASSAVRDGSVAIVKALLKARFSLSGPDGDHLLRVAIDHRQGAISETLMRHGAKASKSTVTSLWEEIASGGLPSALLELAIYLPGTMTTECRIWLRDRALESSNAELDSLRQRLRLEAQSCAQVNPADLCPP